MLRLIFSVGCAVIFCSVCDELQWPKFLVVAIANFIMPEACFLVLVILMISLILRQPKK